MKIIYKEDANVVEFSALLYGDAFSYNDYSGLFLKTDCEAAFDFKSESFVTFGGDEKVIKRKINIAIDDGLPYQE